ncbi:hypothetical protein [Pelosinus sp. IPA-1]|uniref:hypothetical protein n=1 Tax=Pelosinus sp. IPA-1 TaxID=3029569 RepID=UPI0024362771|nr:hypothetical protein [Pelosinus sp. IPA-1]GMB00601.1 hypothetical protein PIPA1_34000 [Pelosinus sp. IPA-1]
MPNESPNTMLETVTHMIDNITKEGTGYDTLVHILSLLCILHILNRTQPSTAAPIQNSPATSANPLHKLLGELTKSGEGGGGPSPDMLMSLLPLLNNPQIKSKLNPANISNMLGLLNNLGGGNNEKAESTKTEKVEKKDPPAAAVTSSLAESPMHNSIQDPDPLDKKDLGRSLNWKTTFGNEKEV